VKTAVSNATIPNEYLGARVIDSTLSRSTPSTGTWNLVSGSYGTPAKGTYLMILKVDGTNVSGLTSIGGIVNESTSGPATALQCQMNITANSSAGTSSPNSGTTCYYATDGTKTLYAWVRADGNNTTVSARMMLIRLN